MYAEEGVEYGELQPSHEELAIGLAFKAADIAADEGEARGAQALALEVGQAQVFPTGHVIARPSGSIALAAAEGSPRKDKGALLRIELLEPLLRSP